MTSSNPRGLLPRATELGLREAAADALAAGLAVRVRVSGESMRPFVLPGDVLTIVPVPSSRARVGQIACFRTENGGMVVHRVVKRLVVDGAVLYRMQGDNQAACSEWVPSGNLLGRVEMLERGGKQRRMDRGVWLSAGLLWLTMGPLFRTLRRLRGRATVRVP